jgi:peroxiredoxin
MSVMIEPSPNHPVQPGEPAPGFELPAITRDGVIRLVDFRGNHPVLLGLFRGLHCAFCRRHIATQGAHSPCEPTNVYLRICSSV